MSTTDLVARLRGIIAAKPPHVTVLADNEEVYPIRVELLRETADAIESGHEANVNCNRNVDHLVARLAAQQTILSTLEGERRRLTERLAAAERVLQDLLDAFVAMPDAGLTDADPRHDWWLRTVQFRDLARNFLGSEKAYSSKPITCNCDCGCEVGGTMEADGKCGWCLSGQHKTASENLNISEHKEGK